MPAASHEQGTAAAQVRRAGHQGSLFLVAKRRRHLECQVSLTHRTADRPACSVPPAHAMAVPGAGSLPHSSMHSGLTASRIRSLAHLL